MSKKRRDNNYDYLRRTYGVAGTGGQNRPGAGASPESNQGAQLPGGPAGVPARVEMEVIEKSECVVGYRQWSLYEAYPEGCLMYSNMQTVWKPFEKIVAGCKPMQDPIMSVFNSSIGRYRPPEPQTHPSPDPSGQCYCGINAWKDRVVVSRSDNPTFIQIVGSVNLWGSVIEYPEGYRGQFAYPKELAVVGCGDRQILERTATKLELAYGVPCKVWE